MFTICLIALVLPAGSQPENKPVLPLPSAAEIHDIRQMLRVDDQFGGEQQTLIRLGERVFPVYRLILTSKDVRPVEITRIFAALAQAKGDRSQFLEHAIDALAHKNSSVRNTAIELIERIGNARDQAPVVALLSDTEWTNGVAAAKALAAIGDKRALAALDAWLNSSSPRKDRNEAFDASFRKDIAKYRDELKARLERATPNK